MRWLTGFASALAFFLGYLWMLGNSERQCWHDKLAGDLVIHVDRRQGPKPQRRLP